MMHRKLFNSLRVHLTKKEFSIISGARQTGKSTLLRQLETHCKQHDIPSVFLNLENKSILGELNADPLNLLKFLPGSDKRITVFVDEIQYLSDASNFMKLLFDEHAAQIKIVASGSSAFYIDKGFRDSMAGRKKIFYLATCAFYEYLELSGKLDLLEETRHLSEYPGKKSTLLTYLQMEWESYMIYGGYPAIITEPDPENKIDMLKEIRDSYVKRDILESGVINETAFYNLFRILAAQTGGLVNINELASTLRVKNETVSSYLMIMRKCFHIALIKPFFRNLRKELIKMPKVYWLDTGLRNCLLNDFQTVSHRSDKGELWENAVFRILLDKYDMDEIHFWRTSAGNEVDFVLPGIGDPVAIEAKFDKNLIKMNKFNLFTRTYPDMTFHLAWMVPFDEDFFQRLVNY